MIKCETIGMIQNSKNNPTIKAVAATPNYSFITNDGDVYLVSNTIVGDDSYKKDVTIPVGDFLNCYLVKAWDGQNLIVDESHIAYGDSQSYASITAGTTLFTISNGKLVIAGSAPASGVYFKAVEKVTLTEKAVKVKVIVVDAAGEAGATTLAGLTDVDTTGATNGQVLKYDGSKWAPAADATE